MSVKLNPRCLKLLEKAIDNPCGLRFFQLRLLCECIGMTLERTCGSHFIYRSNDPFYILSIQKMKDGKAKPYQVRQLVDFIEENDLAEGEKED
ncbi:MAG: hypothetical protein WBC70_02500 [Candidatus Aminicenantales bacterium]